jgi:hypothetical protein
MAAGKGYCLTWMSQNGYFPLENIVHIDPDHFKSVMTEWPGYMDRARDDNSIKPGSLTHMESCAMQEIAQEIALENSQNIWVDGSLKDGEWFKKVFADVRKRFGAYRIAIFNVAASEATVRARAKAREMKTGRGIPEAELVESLKAPDSTLRVLMPLVDFVARIDNSDNSGSSMPKLEAFESVDTSGDWNLIGNFFARTQPSKGDFPARLAPLHLSRVSGAREHVSFTNEQCTMLNNGVFDTGMHQIPVDVIIADPFFKADSTMKKFKKRLKSVGVSMSPTFPVTTKSVSAVPGVAFSFCYGLKHSSYGKGWGGFGSMSKEEQAHPTVCLLVNGGYFYFDVLGVLCGITSFTVDFKSSSTLEFGPSVMLDDATSTTMIEDLKEFWQPITIDFMLEKGTVRVFRQKFTLDDAIGSHACSLEANMRVTNGIPLGSPLLLPVVIINHAETLKVPPIMHGSDQD